MDGPSSNVTVRKDKKKASEAAKAQPVIPLDDNARDDELLDDPPHDIQLDIHSLVDRIGSNRRDTFSLPTNERKEGDPRVLTTVADVRWYADNDPAAILKALDLLRDDSRDCLDFLENNRELYNNYKVLGAEHSELQSKFDTQRKELRQSRNTTNKQAVSLVNLQEQLDNAMLFQGSSSSSEALEEARDKIVEQNDKIVELNIQLRDLARGQPSQGITPFLRTERLTPKVPDPPQLTNGESPTWMEWHQGIQYKRSQNKDHFPTESSEIQYVLSRISGDAYRLLEFRTRHGTTNPFISVNEIFEALGGIFDDTDREEKILREYQALTMGSNDFHKFFIQFYSLGKNLNHSDVQMVTDLRSKIPARLITAMSYSPIDKKSLFAVRDFCIGVDNTYRSVRDHPKPKQDSKTEKPKKSGRYGYSVPRAPTVAITGDTTVIKPKAKAACYICGSTDHLAKDHTANGKDKAAPAQPLLKVNEVHTSEGSEEDLSSESENE